MWIVKSRMRGDKATLLDIFSLSLSLSLSLFYPLLFQIAKNINFKLIQRTIIKKKSINLLHKKQKLTNCNIVLNAKVL